MFLLYNWIEDLVRRSTKLVHRAVSNIREKGKSRSRWIDKSISQPVGPRTLENCGRFIDQSLAIRAKSAIRHLIPRSNGYRRFLSFCLLESNLHRRSKITVFGINACLQVDFLQFSQLRIICKVIFYEECNILTILTILKVRFFFFFF